MKSTSQALWYHKHSWDVLSSFWHLDCSLRDYKFKSRCEVEISLLCVSSYQRLSSWHMYLLPWCICDRALVHQCPSVHAPAALALYRKYTLENLEDIRARESEGSSGLPYWRWEHVHIVIVINNYTIFSSIYHCSQFHCRHHPAKSVPLRLASLLTPICTLAALRLYKLVLIC